MDKLKEQEVYVKSDGSNFTAVFDYDIRRAEWEHVVHVEPQSKILLSKDELRELLEKFQEYIFKKNFPEYEGHSQSFIKQLQEE
jgi:hypothetical protein